MFPPQNSRKSRCLNAENIFIIGLTPSPFNSIHEIFNYSILLLFTQETAKQTTDNFHRLSTQMVDSPG